MIDLRNCDCIDLLATLPDKSISLAIVDPPYGIGASKDSRFGVKHKNSATIQKNYEKKEWDFTPPPQKYFDELFRVSKNQIIWGVNYFFDNRLLGGRVVWNKCVPEGYSKSKCELAFKSFGIGVDYVELAWHGMIQHDMKNKENRIHPTQKPVALYKWLLTHYAKEGDTILDTHLGSMSSAIACYDLDFDLLGCELDKDYFDAGVKRFETHKLQQNLF
jgi:site-specific DNA-methyltransferase (adenine-specific)